MFIKNAEIIYIQQDILFYKEIKVLKFDTENGTCILSSDDQYCGTDCVM